MRHILAEMQLTERMPNRKQAKQVSSREKRADASCSHCCIGQISLETLIVFLIFLSVLGIAYAATSKIAVGSQQKISTVLSEKSFNEFSDKLSQACFLGNGNVRIAEIEGEPAAITSDGAAIFFSTKSFNGSINSTCEITMAKSTSSSSFRIENNDGMIEIS